jgi:hypothetical protein
LVLSFNLFWTTFFGEQNWSFAFIRKCSSAADEPGTLWSGRSCSQAAFKLVAADGSMGGAGYEYGIVKVYES